MQVEGIKSFIETNYDIEFKSGSLSDIENVEEIVLMTSDRSAFLNALFINAFAKEGSDVVLVEGPFMEKVEKSKHQFGVWLNNNISVYSNGFDLKKFFLDEKVSPAFDMGLDILLSIEKLIKDYSFEKDLEKKEVIEREFNKVILKGLDFADHHIDKIGYIKDALLNYHACFPKLIASFKSAIIKAKEIAKRTFLIISFDPRSIDDDFTRFCEDRKLVILFAKMEKENILNGPRDALYQIIDPSVKLRVKCLLENFEMHGPRLKIY